MRFSLEVFKNIQMKGMENTESTAKQERFTTKHPGVYGNLGFSWDCGGCGVGLTTMGYFGVAILNIFRRNIFIHARGGHAAPLTARYKYNGRRVAFGAPWIQGV